MFRLIFISDWFSVEYYYLQINTIIRHNTHFKIPTAESNTYAQPTNRSHSNANVNT